jgi:DNA repair protein RadA/Sms
VALAIASALRDKPVGKGTACFGEVGLTGDVRFVSGAPRRTGEVLKMGYKRIIRPEGKSEESFDGRTKKDASVIEVGTLEEAVAVALL